MLDGPQVEDMPRREFHAVTVGAGLSPLPKRRLVSELDSDLTQNRQGGLVNALQQFVGDGFNGPDAILYGRNARLLSFRFPGGDERGRRRSRLRGVRGSAARIEHAGCGRTACRRGSCAVTPPTLSVVIPVYNEEAGLPALFARLYPALDALGVRYEVIFVNDGSRDRSAALLKDQFDARPDVTRVILFNANYGQHLAILAGFERVRGERIVTLDADLQNPPEEIAKLLAAMDAGADYVGGVRRTREDAWWRRTASRLMNRVRERITRSS